MGEIKHGSKPNGHPRHEALQGFLVRSHPSPVLYICLFRSTASQRRASVPLDDQFLVNEVPWLCSSVGQSRVLMRSVMGLIPPGAS